MVKRKLLGPLIRSRVSVNDFQWQTWKQKLYYWCEPWNINRKLFSRLNGVNQPNKFSGGFRSNSLYYKTINSLALKITQFSLELDRNISKMSSINWWQRSVICHRHSGYLNNLIIAIIDWEGMIGSPGGSPGFPGIPYSPVFRKSSNYF